MLLLPCLSSGAGATASTRPAVVHAARKPFTHRRLWNSSSKHRRGSVLVACSSGAIFSVNLMKQQCSISRRTEVELQSGCTGRYPFRVATFNILVSCRHAWLPQRDNSAGYAGGVLSVTFLTQVYCRHDCGLPHKRRYVRLRSTNLSA